MESKECYIYEHIDALMTKLFPCNRSKKKAELLTKMISDRKMFGSDGQEGYNEVFLGQARRKFEHWVVL